MDQQSEDQDKVRRLRLPSGKQIEVVVFGATGRRAAAAAKTIAAPSRRLHICGDCGSNLVHPIDWEEAAADTWRLELRCPNCEWIGGAACTTGASWSSSTRSSSAAWRPRPRPAPLTHANMEEQIERFIHALEATT